MDSAELLRRQDAERQLVAYAEMYAGRGQMVRDALEAGLNRNQIHKLSRMARATIDKLLHEAR